MPFDFCRGYASVSYLKQRQRIAIGSLTFLSVLFLVCLNLGIGYSQERAFDKAAYTRAVEYCRGGVTRPIALSDDKRILCFDGWITLGQDISPVEGLEENGLFVVRSFGGSIATAIALADLLRERHATVLIYDYCNSACASYLFIASDQTLVLKDSIVAWHHGRSGLPDCSGMKLSGDSGPKRLQKSPCPGVPLEQQARYRQVQSLHDRFYAEWTVDPKFEFPPQSFHVRKILKSMLDGTGVYPDVAWMWNPRYYRNVLKTKISYEAYPESQTEVDEIVARFHFRRVIHDP
jgi:hypothetical protein